MRKLFVYGFLKGTILPRMKIGTALDLIIEALAKKLGLGFHTRLFIVCCRRCYI